MYPTTQKLVAPFLLLTSIKYEDSDVAAESITERRGELDIKRLSSLAHL
jgi:hypothetical protein